MSKDRAKEFFAPNPFLGNQIVRDPKKFFGQEELFKWAYAIIANGGSISLPGPSRIGKGSFLYCLRFLELQQRYAPAYTEQLQRCLFVFLDIRSYAHRSWDDFFKALNREIVNQCCGSVNLATTSYEGSEGFVTLLDEIIEQSYHPVLSFDSFEKLRDNERLNGFLPPFLRSEGSRVSYAIGSTLPLDKIFVNEPLNSPFYNIFAVRKIGALSYADACALVTVTAEEAGLPFSEREASWIVRQGGGHPFFLRLISQLVFEAKSANPEIELDLEQLEDQAYQALLTHLKSIWGSMNQEQQEQMCRQVQKADGSTFYESALLRRFVEEQCGGEVAIEIKDIKDALKKIRNLSELGKSRLRYLRVVRARLNGNAQPTPSQIGFAIREELTKAHKQLEGVGVRTDMDPGWEAYNILHYCYFKHQIRSDALSMRLGVSSRSLYRKKKEACERLLIALREIENKGSLEQ